MSSEPLISVIIPAYNASQYIGRCVLSIQKQTYHNIEIIIVNDGSADDTLKIAENIALQDKRVLVVDIPNGGVSNARNVGISRAHGEYIAFADADDRYHPDMLATLYRLSVDNDAEMSMCSRTNVTDGKVNDIVRGEPVHFYDGAVDISQLASHFDLNVVWNKLCHRSLFDGVNFPTDMSYGEDLSVSLELIGKTKHVVYVPDGLYYYLINTSSASYNLSPEKLQSDIIVKTKLYKYMKQKGTDITIPFDFLFGAYVKAYSGSGKKKDIKKQYNRFFFSNITLTARKIKCLLFLVSPYLYFRLR